MNELALFAGAGGGILAGHLLGWRTICAVERDAHAAEVLAQRQNDGILAPFPVWSDITTFNGYPWQGRVDVISGGFPCQDISAAGRGTGITGKRSGLWKEMARIIREVRPCFVFVENSPLLTRRGLDVVLGDLAEMGFNAEWGVFGAADAGAPHQRDRVWILAYTDAGQRNGKIEAVRAGRSAADCRSVHVAYADSSWGLQPQRGQQEQRGRLGDCCEALPNANIHEHKSDSHAREGQRKNARGKVIFPDPNGKLLDRGRNERPGRRNEFTNSSEDAADSSRQGFPQPEQQAVLGTRRREERRATTKCDRRPTEPGLGRMADGLAYRLDRPWPAEPDGVPRVARGVPHRVGRLKGIGNGQVPACAVMAWRELYRRLFA